MVTELFERNLSKRLSLRKIGCRQTLSKQIGFVPVKHPLSSKCL